MMSEFVPKYRAFFLYRMPVIQYNKNTEEFGVLFFRKELL